MADMAEILATKTPEDLKAGLFERTASGIVVNPPDSINGDMVVALLDNLDWTFLIKAGRWMPRAERIPVLNTLCLIAFDEDMQAYVPVWEGANANLDQEARDANEIAGFKYIECVTNNGATTFTANPQEPFHLVARDMRMGPFTPTRNCYWQTEYHLLVGTAAAAWERTDLSMMLMESGSTDVAKADATGLSSHEQTIVNSHNAFTYSTLRCRDRFKLVAGQTYWVRPYCTSQITGAGHCFWYRASIYFHGYTKVEGFW